jgi:hypothetical protein
LISRSGQHSSSYRDPSGFVFVHHNALYLKINQCYKEHFEILLGSGLYQQLTSKGLLVINDDVPYNITGDASYYKTFKPEPIPFISYPYEWCFNQLKDAALLTLEVNREALARGLILKDATPYNVQFHQGKPIFIDTLSFEKYHEEEPWIAYRQFCEQFLAPLALMHYLKYPLSQLFLAYPDGIPISLVSRMLPLKSRLQASTLLHIHLQAKLSGAVPKKQNKQAGFSRSKLKNILESLAAAVRSFHLDQPSGTWSGYYTEALERPDYIADKKRIISSWLDTLPPLKSAFDAGANEGLFSALLSERGILTISGDSDHYSINNLYKKTKAESINNILPLLLDLALPTPGIGVHNQERLSLTERLSVDLVMALAVIHHLAIGRNIPFTLIAEQLKQYGPYLIIEFVPKEDKKVQEMLEQKKDIYSDYSEPGFREAFTKNYEVLRETSIGHSGRKLFLMKVHEH